MKTCESCYWCQLALTGLKDFKCNLRPATVRFNYPKFHGWFCDDYIVYDEAVAKVAQSHEDKSDGE